MINLKYIEAFAVVADLGSFRRAAERLNTTQPNISNRIAQLEVQLGVVLMERDAGSVRLTQKGIEMLAAARAVLKSVDTFVAAADDATLFDGVIRLGVSETVAHTWLRPFLLRMKDRFPHVSVELTVDLSANLSEALFARELDLAFQNGPFNRKARGTVPLGQAHYIWVASPGIAGEGEPLSGRDMAKHRILTHARRTVPYSQLQEHFLGLAVTPRLVPSSNIGACLQMTLDGLGIACLPREMIGKLLDTGQLIQLDYNWRPDPLSFAARYEMDPVPTYMREAIEIAQELSPPPDDD